VVSSARVDPCQLAHPGAASYVPLVASPYDPADPPTPLAVVRGFLGVALALATAGLVVSWISDRHVPRALVALIGFLWVFWGVFHDVLGLIVQPLAGLLAGQLGGGADAGPPVRIDIEQETRMLETLLAHPPPVVHRELLAGIRLAEIYRTHQHDRGKSDALLARLRAKYPHAPELVLADGIST
jgi:hypothetical protein